MHRSIRTYANARAAVAATAAAVGGLAPLASAANIPMPPSTSHVVFDDYVYVLDQVFTGVNAEGHFVTLLRFADGAGKLNFTVPQYNGLIENLNGVEIKLTADFCDTVLDLNWSGFTSNGNDSLSGSFVVQPAVFIGDGLVFVSGGAPLGQPGPFQSAGSLAIPAGGACSPGSSSVATVTVTTGLEAFVGPGNLTIDTLAQVLINTGMGGSATPFSFGASLSGTMTCTLEVTYIVEGANQAPTSVVDLDPLSSFVIGSGGEIIVTEGAPFHASVTGFDADPGDTLTLVTDDVPATAVVTPAAPAQGVSPFIIDFSWTPPLGLPLATAHNVGFQFTDASGASVLSVLPLVVNKSPVAVCSEGSIQVECNGFGGANVTLDGSQSFDPDGDILAFQWANVPFADTPNAATVTGFFPVGTTTATLVVTDGRGGVANCDVSVTVVDTTPPNVQLATSTTMLWPPNHSMRAIDLVVEATDVCSLPSEMSLVVARVSSDEPDDVGGSADGSTTGDVSGADGYVAPVGVESQLVWNAALEAWVGTIDLRAERSGEGDGRCYTIEIVAADMAGNTTAVSACVVVPHDMRGGRR